MKVMEKIVCVCVCGGGVATKERVSGGRATRGKYAEVHSIFISAKMQEVTKGT